MAFIRTFDFTPRGSSLKPVEISLVTPSGRWTFPFHFNIRAARSLVRTDPDDGAWFLGCKDMIGTMLLRSIRVTLSPDLFRRHRVGGLALPPGVLRCEGPRDPQRGDLGSSLCVIVYEE